jgi:hypothetical protein
VACESCGNNIVQVVIHGATGLAKVALRRGIAPSGVIAARRAQCNACENNLAGVCLICFCVIAAKTSLIQECCPDTPSRWKTTKTF